MNPDLLAAVAAYLAAAQKTSVGVSSTNAGVWANYASQGTYPYAVITNPRETYELSSNDPATGASTLVVAVGILHVMYYGSSEAQVRALARQCLLLLSDPFSAGSLNSLEGTVKEMLPIDSTMVPIADQGTDSATVYCRVAAFRYVSEFYM